MPNQQLELSTTTRKRTRDMFLSNGRKNYFGETLKELRQQKDFTQDEAAKLLGFTQSQWCSYENGATRPNLDIVIAIANKFGIPPVALICKSLDKSRFTDPVLEFTFQEYEAIEDMIEAHRKKVLKEKIKAKMQELQSYI